VGFRDGAGPVDEWWFERRRRTLVRVSLSAAVEFHVLGLAPHFARIQEYLQSYPETATPSAYDWHWPKDCSICTKRSGARAGNGLKTSQLTEMLGCLSHAAGGFGMCG